MEACGGAETKSKEFDVPTPRDLRSRGRSRISSDTEYKVRSWSPKKVERSALFCVLIPIENSVFHVFIISLCTQLPSIRF